MVLIGRGACSLLKRVDRPRHAPQMNELQCLLGAIAGIGVGFTLGRRQSCRKPARPPARARSTRRPLRSLARDGVRTIINLRTLDEPIPFDEPQAAADLGLRYVSIVQAAIELVRSSPSIEVCCVA
jgi:hypothetical protein